MIIDNTITGEILVDAFKSDVWEAWTTESGAKTFFAPDCKIDLRPGGAYEMYFDPDAPEGYRGGKGCRILALEDEQMLSFTWNAPPSMPDIRGQFTHVTVRFEHDYYGTRVTLSHDGWGEGQAWGEAMIYFDKAWNKIVLPRLKYRFCVAIIDWTAPLKMPDLGKV
jgi:uncharacterized protein YndB with AHSA1/START domain